MASIEWTSKAFTALEVLPQQAAFEIVRRTDMLGAFPEMGVRLSSPFKLLQKYRQLVINREYRVIYDFDNFDDRVYILSVQRCRQKLPSARDLKRREAED